MRCSLRESCGVGLLVLCLGQGCEGEPQPPVIGPNMVSNGTFESELSGWWSWTDSEGGTASTSAEAADDGRAGLVLYKGKDGFNSMVGQPTEAHEAWQTYEIHARFKGTKGGEHLTFSFHGQGVEVVAETRWRTVSRMVLMPEPDDDLNARISVSTEDATVYVDNVSFSLAEVERGDADKVKDNLLHNGSFESELGLWTFWTDSPEGRASTTPDERNSGYSGLELRRGATGNFSVLKQPLPDPVLVREQYRIEAFVRGANGGENVSICLQMEHEPWEGPCTSATAAGEWQRLSQTVTIDEGLSDEDLSVVLSLGSEGTVYVDDVTVVRTRRR
ncbi:carbohydrate binding domain-containing protein [Hyalangium versicolor]|uniref:carbohydrate binding domain-containing protein n=1 Tax=Hyalangium versicolor TaxID=2861190 RepID=UPI001CCE21C4|nr:carbohydrate binding domain-containing protein [Hyalangium versicolor]